LLHKRTRWSSGYTV